MIGPSLATNGKSSILGVIPSDWEVSSLGELCTKTTVGFVGSMSHLFTERGVPLLRGTNVLPGGLNLEDMRYVSADTHRKWQKSELRPGDVIMVRVGYPGTAAVVPDTLGAANAASLVIARPDPSLLNAGYAVQVLNSPSGRSRIQSGLVGGAQQVFNTTLAAQFPIAVPPKNEQDRIADALQDADKLIFLMKRLVTKKEEIKQGMMQQLLTGQTRLPGFTKSWRNATIGELCTSIAGGGTPARHVREYWGGSIPWATVKDVTTFNPRRTQEYITRDAVSASSTRLVPAGTLVLATRMTVGKAVIFDVDVCINQDLKALSLTPEADSRYLYHWFESNRNKLARTSGGSTVAGISTADIRSCEIFVPAVEEQRAIAGVIGHADLEIRALRHRLAKARAVKLGMAHELLTGRRRLARAEVPG